MLEYVQSCTTDLQSCVQYARQLIQKFNSIEAGSVRCAPTPIAHSTETDVVSVGIIINVEIFQLMTRYVRSIPNLIIL